MSVNEDRSRQLLTDMAEPAQAVAEAMIVAISKMRPVPSPLLTAVACRLVGLYAAKSLLQTPGANDMEIRDAFLALDRLTNVEELRLGNIEFSEEIVADLVNGARAPGSRLPNLGHDPTVFDIDAWEGDKGT
jgi:hypothetical protein